MDLNLIEIERTAFALKKAKMWQDAISQYEHLLRIQPDWEHGYGWFNLAECYEESHRIGKADYAYKQAELISPSDPILVGGRASFLYLYGETIETINQHIKLLSIDLKNNDQDMVKDTMMTLSSLAARLNWSEEELKNYIKEQERK